MSSERERELEESLAGMLESFDLTVANDSPLPFIAKGIVQGFFIHEDTRARKLLEESE